MLLGRPKLFGFLGRQEDVFIPWAEIDTVGADVILVHTPLPAEAPRRKPSFLSGLFS